MEYSSPVPSSPALSATMVADPVALLASADFEMTTVTPAELASPTPDIKIEADEALDENGDSEKKPTKKRKSWGQVLPEPKTNLPPRKRAKTEDEKEQRRVERVIRNRKAASASRERKRQEAEALALRNKELEAQLALLQERNSQLERELKIARPELGGVSSPSNESVTFSQELFPSQPLSTMSQSSLDLLNDLLNKPEQQAPKTVDPMTISPALSPVPEDQEFDDTNASEPVAQAPQAPRAAVETSQTTSSNHPSTQYPAAVLWHDLQCQRPVEAVPWMSLAMQNHITSVLLMLQLASSLSAAFLNHWARLSSTPSQPQGTSRRTPTTSWLLPPRPTALISIILAVTSPHSRLSSSTSSSAPTNRAMAQPTSSNSSKKTLRLRTLRKLLTCNRQLARPLQDATLEVLRLSLARGNGAQVVKQEFARESVAPAWRQVADGNWPSKERLISLLWAIRATERRIKLREQGVQDVKRSKTARVRLGRPRGRPWDTI